MSLDIKAIRERAEAASSGPWITKDNHGAGGVTHFAVIGQWGEMPCSITPMHLKRAQDIANGEFITHAREDVPALCDEIESLRAKLEKANSRIESCVGQLRSAVQLSRQLGTPVADHKLLLDLADELQGIRITP